MQLNDIARLSYKLKADCNNDINQLLDMYNCEIYYADFCNIYGYNHKINDVNYLYINKNLKKHEKEFVILHEMAHIILHKSDCRYFLKERMNDRAELQANLFAVVFLGCIYNDRLKDDVIQKIINYIHCNYPICDVVNML